MSNITEQILNAIELIASDTVSKLHFDKTVQAKIFSIVDLDIGEYKVEYNTSIFSAFAEDVNETYDIGDYVYVKVPEGDFSNKKIITSLVTSKSLSEQQLSQLQNQVFSVSPSFVDMYPGLAEEPYGVIAGISPGEPGSEFFIYRGPDEYNPADYHGLFQQYGSQYENIRISGSFLTQFHCIHDKGNYGLEIGFYTENNKTISYRLDLNSFNGSPYSFSIASPQSVIIRVTKQSLLGLKYIKLFEENFIPDKFIENGIITDRENLTEPNIFVQDIAIDFVEVLDLSNVSYYLDIAALQGIAFSSGISTIVLQGRLLHQGKDILTEDNCTCQWFKRDPSVMIGSDNYNSIAGFGWASLNCTQSALTLTTADVEYQQEYKLLVLYNENINLSAQITIFNNNNASKYQNGFSISQRTNQDIISLYITNQELVGDWYVGYLDGAYAAVDNAIGVNSIDINQYLGYSSITFYCDVKTKAGIRLGVLEYKLVDSTSQDDVIISFIGEDTFRYDANGDFSYDSAEKDRTLQAQLTWKEGIGSSYSITWMMRQPGGTETIIPGDRNSAYYPIDSMIDALWIDNFNILHYNIKKKYKVNYNNNILTIRIHTNNGQDYYFNKEILFLKDGDQGTNGTTYVAAIRPCDENGIKLSGLHPLVYNNGWQNPITLRCYVYKDGELLNLDSNYTLGFDWSGQNISIENSGDTIKVNGTSTISAGSISAELEFFAKAQVSIIEKDHTNSSIFIYASYPIDVAVGGLDYEKINIDDIPSYIKYSSSGLNPSFYSNDINYYYDQESYNNLIKSLNTKLLTIRSDSENKKYLNPTIEFLYENSNNTDSNIAVLRMDDPSSSARYLIHPIIMYLDTYGNESINGWDGTKLAVDEKAEQYLFAPTFGAGTKDSANRFTGVVMGKDSQQKKVGIYGYQNGVNTYGLLEDGTAYFGASGKGGRIEINGTNATITGGGGGNATSGMTITLANLNASEKTEAIKLGAGAFTVLYDGSFTATKATITGNITATSGQIGGWNIGDTNLNSAANGNNKVGLDSSANNWWAIWAGRTTAGSAYDSSADPSKKISGAAPFVVTKDGFLHATNAYISGNISSTSGSIGGWIIDNGYLYSNRGSSTKVVGMASQGNAAFWVGSGFDQNSVNGSASKDNSYFLVTRDGQVFCKNIRAITGSIGSTDTGSGGWTINSNRISGSSSGTYVVLDSSRGISAGGSSSSFSTSAPFSVTIGGKLKATDVEVTGTIRAKDLRLTGSNQENPSNALQWNNDTRTYQIQGEYLRVKQIKVGPTDNQINFEVDSNGNVYMRGTVTISGNQDNFKQDGKMQYSVGSDVLPEYRWSWHYARASSDKWGRSYNLSTDSWGAAFLLSDEVTRTSIIQALDKAKATKNDFITTVTSNGVTTPTIWSAEIYSPNIYANEFWAMPLEGNDSTGHFILGSRDKKIKLLDISYTGYGSTGEVLKEVNFNGYGFSSSSYDRLATNLNINDFALLRLNPQYLYISPAGGLDLGDTIQIGSPYGEFPYVDSVLGITANTANIVMNIGAKLTASVRNMSIINLYDCALYWDCKYVSYGTCVIDGAGDPEKYNPNKLPNPNPTKKLHIRNAMIENCSLDSRCTVNATAVAVFG